MALTLFIMSELIINSKLATAGPRHFELQKYPPKENYTKNSCFIWDLNLGPVNYNLKYVVLPLDQGDKI